MSGILVLGQGDVQDRGSEKEDGYADGRVEQAFFEAAFCPEDRTFAPEGSAQAGAALLQQNGRNQQGGKRELDDG